MGHVSDNATLRTLRIVVGLTTRLKVSVQSTNFLRPFISNNMGFVPLKRIIKFLFVTKIHIDRITFTLDERSTKPYALVLIRALNSSIMASFQFGSDKTSFGLRGRGEGVTSVKRLSGTCGLKYPVHATGSHCPSCGGAKMMCWSLGYRRVVGPWEILERWLGRGE